MQHARRSIKRIDLFWKLCFVLIFPFPKPSREEVKRAGMPPCLSPSLSVSSFRQQTSEAVWLLCRCCCSFLLSFLVFGGYAGEERGREGGRSCKNQFGQHSKLESRPPPSSSSFPFYTSPHSKLNIPPPPPLPLAPSSFFPSTAFGGSSGGRTKRPPEWKGRREGKLKEVTLTSAVFIWERKEKFFFRFSTSSVGQLGGKGEGRKRGVQSTDGERSGERKRGKDSEKWIPRFSSPEWIPLDGRAAMRPSLILSFSSSDEICPFLPSTPMRYCSNRKWEDMSSTGGDPLRN